MGHGVLKKKMKMYNLGPIRTPPHPPPLGPKGGTPDSAMNKLETTVINVLTHSINLALSLLVLEKKIFTDSLILGGLGPPGGPLGGAWCPF